ncbi:YciI family protein [Streptomyces avicenniae]|uniref:YciI family protein n=1 Tax=Streptomyces avicenniae TaxID=500153 RepID=UPI00069B3427|nr:YciI family protein [Streptomyces avicenniae]
MRFLLTHKSEQAPDESLFAEMGAFIEELTASGTLLATGGMEPGGSLISFSGGELTVTDGPFTEAKEAAGGFALIDVPSRDAAIELARRFFALIGEGEGRIRQVHG